jgi:hypothetical protein
MNTPLLFLDVDGVMLPFGTEPLDLRPGLGPLLTALPAELVWATAWEHGANDDIAPRIGLPSLPVVEWRVPTQAEEATDDYLGLNWKTRQVVEWAAGRDFAWTDDEVTDADREWVAQNHRGRALLHRVQSLIGLTAADVEVVERWLQGVAAAGRPVTPPGEAAAQPPQLPQPPPPPIPPVPSEPATPAGTTRTPAPAPPDPAIG